MANKALKLMEARLRTRREFLSFMGRSAVVTAGAASVASPLLTSCTGLEKGEGNEGPLQKIPTTSHSSADELRLAPGFQFHAIVSAGDILSKTGLQAGYNNDYLAFFPLDGAINEGVLCINNESVHPGFVSGHWNKDQSTKTQAQVEKEQKAVGVTQVHIRCSDQGKWSVVANSKYNRRIDGKIQIPIVSADPLLGARVAVGTLANCAGGVTPWGNYLTCEENYQDFYGEADYSSGKRKLQPHQGLQWDRHYSYPPEHYGWVVEINPFSGEAKKLTALGRFCHEGATVRPTLEGRCVVYMGDDAAGEHIYKFIAARPESLDEGVLYVADVQMGQWKALSVSENPLLKKKFITQTELLVRTREAARMVGATPMDRPEGIAVCPMTGAVYVSLTNNAATKNYFGSILKIEEKNNDPLALEFKASTFIAGGPETGFACPDNIAFDRHGDLWMTSDISGSKMNQGVYEAFKNNGLFYIPLKGPSAGKAHLIATAPIDAEFTGPTFSPDGATLFLSVQHPGELTQDPQNPTSRWPKGDGPVPTVVAITGGFLKPVGKQKL